MAALAAASPSPWIFRTCTSKSSKFQSYPPSLTSLRPLCSGKSHSQSQSSDLKFVLHDVLDSSGFNTTLARDSRKEFMSQIEKLTAIERETSICINRRVDLARTALFIAAEDDSLVSDSSAPLPIDSFVNHLIELSMRFCCDCSSSLVSSPVKFLESLENYLHVKEGFRRNNGECQLDSQALYLHFALARRTGSATMLSVIYSEILKVLRLWSLLDFDCEILFPHDRHSLPKVCHKQKIAESDQPRIITTQSLLEEILRNLKEAHWPFVHDHTKSLFLRAANAANCIDRSISPEESGLRPSSAKAAKCGPDCGVSTSVCSWDMRLSLSACERLILLESDPNELRDYSVLLYHCGLYEHSLQYLKLYQERKSFYLLKQPSNESSNLENDAVQKLSTRLTLISMEEGWSKPSHG